MNGPHLPGEPCPQFDCRADEPEQQPQPDQPYQDRPHPDQPYPEELTTPEAVEAAAKEMDPLAFDPDAHIPPLWEGQPAAQARKERQDGAREWAAAVLTAAAPLIAKKALLDAAEEVRLTCPPCGPDGPTDEIHQAIIDTAGGIHSLITARAAALTPEGNLT